MTAIVPTVSCVSVSYGTLDTLTMARLDNKQKVNKVNFVIMSMFSQYIEVFLYNKIYGHVSQLCIQDKLVASLIAKCRRGVWQHSPDRGGMTRRR